MKRYFLIIALITCFVSCKKDTEELVQTSTINVVNMILDAGNVKINSGASSDFAYSKSSTTIGYGANSFYGAVLGSRIITVVSAGDTTKKFFSGSFDLMPVNTLYLTGQSSAVETVFRQEENIPFIDAVKLKPDSSAYIRFVNLSPNSTPLNIKLASASSNDANNIAYKSITEFKKYEAKTTTANYIFEVRDAATNTLRTTITLAPNNIRHKTLSIIFKGLMGTTSGTNAFGFSQVNYF